MRQNRRCAPVSNGPRQPDFFKARSKTLIPSWSGSLHLAKYEWTVRHFGNSLGKNLHWQPVRNRYSTAQHLIQVHRRGFGASAHVLQQEPDFFKFLSADVAGVTLSHCDIFASKGKIVNTL